MAKIAETKAKVRRYKGKSGKVSTMFTFECPDGGKMNVWASPKFADRFDIDQLE